MSSGGYFGTLIAVGVYVELEPMIITWGNLVIIKNAARTPRITPRGIR